MDAKNVYKLTQWYIFVKRKQYVSQDELQEIVMHNCDVLKRKYNPELGTEANYICRVIDNALCNIYKKRDNTIPLGFKLIKIEEEWDENWIISNAIKKLNVVQKRVIYLMFWKNYDMTQVGKILGISCERVRQIRKKALEVIKNEISISA